MATLSRAKLNKARHKQGWFAQQEKEANEKKKEQQKNFKPINEVEHKEKLELLKKIGLIKENGCKN